MHHDHHQVVRAPREQQAAVGHDPQAPVRPGLPEDDRVRDRPDGQPSLHHPLAQRDVLRTELQGAAQGKD